MNHRSHFQYKPLEKVSMEVIGKNGFKVHKVHKTIVNESMRIAAANSDNSPINAV